MTTNGLLAQSLDPADVVSIIRYKSPGEQQEILRLLLHEISREQATLVYELLAKGGWQL